MYRCVIEKKVIGGKCATSAQEEHQNAAHWMQFQWFRAMLYIESIAVLNALAIYDQKIIKTNLLNRRGSKFNIKIIFCIYMRIRILNYSEHKEVLSPCVYSILYFITSNDNIWSYVAGTHMTSGLLEQTFPISRILSRKTLKMISIGSHDLKRMRDLQGNPGL